MDDEVRYDHNWSLEMHVEMCFNVKCEQYAKHWEQDHMMTYQMTWNHPYKTKGHKNAHILPTNSLH